MVKDANGLGIYSLAELLPLMCHSSNSFNFGVVIKCFAMLEAYYFLLGFSGFRKASRKLLSHPLVFRHKKF